MHIFDSRFPGQRPWAGDGFGMMIVTRMYIAMSAVAWVVALIITIVIKIIKSNKANDVG